MRADCRSCASLLATTALIATLPGTALGQPAPDPASSETGPKIPVTAPSPELMGGEMAASSTMLPPISLEHPIEPNTYVCGPGDVFELEFWGQQNFRLRITVDLEGRTFISKVGFVSVAGKTLNAVRNEVKRLVRRDYPGLQFDLTLLSPRTFLVHVVDNVKQPGTYAAHAVDRVSTVLAKPTITGSRRRIVIRHRDGTKVTADLVKYELTGDTEYDPLVLDGDVISVPAAENVVTIAGAVRRPGTYELVKSKDVDELLALAGGLKPSVTRTLPVRVTRRDDKDHTGFIELPYTAGGMPSNAPLRDDDQVFVSGADEMARSVLLIGAVTGADPLDTATTSKRLPYVDGDTVRTVIERAGGIRAPGDLNRSYISRPRPNKVPELIPVDLEALLVKRDLRADKKVMLGDTVVVPPMQYSVMVEGAVARPGIYPFNPRFGLAEYVAHAGGRTRTAKDLDEARLIDPDGATHKFVKGIRPSPGDAILVPERNFSRPEVVQLVIAGAGLVLSGVALTLAATR
jgi:protein involved in polysaccharide export with SLBB domain